jgi:hypothetical protein
MASHAAIKRDTDHLARIKARLRTPGEYMVISNIEMWSLQFFCMKCKKRVLFSGMCYQCATGRVPTLSLKRVMVEPKEKSVV